MVELFPECLSVHLKTGKPHMLPLLLYTSVVQQVLSYNNKKASKTNKILLLPKYPGRNT